MKTEIRITLKILITTIIATIAHIITTKIGNGLLGLKSSTFIIYSLIGWKVNWNTGMVESTTSMGIVSIILIIGICSILVETITYGEKTKT